MLDVSKQLLHWAAQLEQMSREMDATAHNKSIPIFAAHELMVARQQVIYAARHLTKESARNHWKQFQIR